MVPLLSLPGGCREGAREGRTCVSPGLKSTPAQSRFHWVSPQRGPLIVASFPRDTGPFRSGARKVTPAWAPALSLHPPLQLLKHNCLHLPPVSSVFLTSCPSRHCQRSKQGAFTCARRPPSDGQAASRKAARSQICISLVSPFDFPACLRYATRLPDPVSLHPSVSERLQVLT